MPPSNNDARSQDKPPDRPRSGAPRWPRTLLLICWIPVLAYAAYTTWSLLRLPAAAWDNPQAVASALVPAPLTGSGVPSWAGIASALAFLVLLAGCGWASVDWVRERRARRMPSQAPVAAMPPRTAPLWTSRPTRHASGGETPAERTAGGAPAVDTVKPAGAAASLAGEPPAGGRSDAPDLATPLAEPAPDSSSDIQPAVEAAEPALDTPPNAQPAADASEPALGPASETEPVEVDAAASEAASAAGEPAAQPDEATFTPRVFVSHSSADNSFGRELERRLRTELGDPDAVFYDSDGGLVGSDEWLKRLQHEITERTVFVLILSPQAFKSGWVDQELSLALREAVSVGGKVIVPVLHQGDDVWPFLRNFQIVDFTKHSFDEAFADLMVAVRLGHSRRTELEGMRLEHLGPPYDLDLLPVPERFVGRARDLDWALDRLAPREPIHDGGLASIAAANGLAGIGKSALAGQAVRILYATNRFPDGIAVVLCNGLTDPVAVLKAALSRFDPQRREPQETQPQQLRDLAKQVFDGRRALVVLDNVESDWPVEDVLAPLRVAGAAVLLTSRVRLPASAVPTEASRMLELLSPEEAVDVFAEYVGRGARLDLTLSEQDAVGRIVRALGYHTLAVKLAAARAQGRDLSRVAREYEADPRLGVHLKDGREAVEVVLASSVASLTEHARRLFSALGAFATTDVGRRAALAVAERLADADPRASLDALVDLRLVDTYVAEQLPPEPSDRERVRLHPLVRTYAEQLLAEGSEVDDSDAHAAVAVWYADYANATPDLALTPDEANVAGALEWLQEHDADDPEAQALIARICNGMRGFWRDTGRTRAGLRYLPWGIAAAERMAERTGERGERVRAANIAAYYGDILQNVGRLLEAEQAFQTDLAQRREIEDRQGEGAALSRLGHVAQQRGRLDEAEDYYQQSLAIRREVQDRRGEGVVLFQLALIAEARGDLDRAEALHRESLAVGVEVQSGPDVADSLLALGRFLMEHQRNPDEGCQMLREAVRLYAEMGLPGLADAVEAALEVGCMRIEDLAQFGLAVREGGGTDDGETEDQG